MANGERRHIGKSTRGEVDVKLFTNPHSQFQFRKSDIFLEPFEEGICIEDELTKSHRLIFNKIPVRQYQSFIVTKEREKQSELLNIKDIEASLVAMVALEGFVFYNSGKRAGASQDHKHL